MDNKKTSISHDKAVVQSLRDNPDLAVEYIRAAIEENSDEPAALMVAMRHVAQAYGMRQVAESAGLSRESLYRALSAKGNPTVKTIAAVLKTLGLRLSVTSSPANGGAP